MQKHILWPPACSRSPCDMLLIGRATYHTSRQACTPVVRMHRVTASPVIITSTSGRQACHMLDRNEQYCRCEGLAGELRYSCTGKHSDLVQYPKTLCALASGRRSRDHDLHRLLLSTVTLYHQVKYHYTVTCVVATTARGQACKAQHTAAQTCTPAAGRGCACASRRLLADKRAFLAKLQCL